MPFEPYDFAHYRALAAEAFTRHFPGIDPYTLVRPGEEVANDAAVLANVLGEMGAALDARLPAILDQAFSDTAGGVFLDRIAAKYSLARLPARRATGRAVITGLAAAATVPDGTALFGLSGQGYASLGAVQADATGRAEIDVEAEAIGPQGNLAAAAPLSLAIAGAVAVVGPAGLSGGALAEVDDELRARIRQRELNPGGYGRASDYVAWAMEVSGVTRVWVWDARIMGAGNVGVVVAADEAGTAPVPSDALLDEVRTVLEARKPAEVGLRLHAPVARPVDVTVPALTPRTPAVQEFVRVAISEAFRDLAVPGAPGNPSTFPRSWLVQAIANAPGEVSHAPIAPADDIVLAALEVPVLGTLTFTDP